MRFFKIIPVLILIGTIVPISCTTAIIDESVANTSQITRTVTYSGDIKNIMFNNCVTCHGGNAPSAGLDLTTYESVKNATANGNLIPRVKDISNPMPPSGLMSIQNRQLLDKWISDGFPQ